MTNKNTNGSKIFFSIKWVVGVEDLVRWVSFKQFPNIETLPNPFQDNSQQTISFSMSTIETLEKGVKNDVNDCWLWTSKYLLDYTIDSNFW